MFRKRREAVTVALQHRWVEKEVPPREKVQRREMKGRRQVLSDGT